MSLYKTVVPCGLIAILAGCGGATTGSLSDRAVDYKRQRVAEADLEVPPDLTKSSITDTLAVPPMGDAATYSDYQQQRSGRADLNSSAPVVPEVDRVKVMRDGEQRWLEIQSPPAEVWSRVLAFWRDNGVVLVEQNPAVGVMKTDWLENRADIKQGFLTNFLRKALDSFYSAATRDQFRVRLEPGSQPGRTDLYLTHRGVEEQVVTTVVGSKENSYWAPRPTDPQLEAEMLRRIMLYLGVPTADATARLAQAAALQMARAELVKTQEQTWLRVNADFAGAWRLVGVALERVGFAVEDRERDNGVYLVRYDDPSKEDQPGLLDKLAFWRQAKTFDNTQYRVRIEANDASSRVTILNAQGQPETSATGLRILTLIQEQIR